MWLLSRLFLKGRYSTGIAKNGILKRVWSAKAYAMKAHTGKGRACKWCNAYNMQNIQNLLLKSNYIRFLRMNTLIRIYVFDLQSSTFLLRRLKQGFLKFHVFRKMKPNSPGGNVCIFDVALGHDHALIFLHKIHSHLSNQTIICTTE